MRFTGTFVFIVALFITALITANIVAVKPIVLLPVSWFGQPSIIVPASILIFPISFILGDVLTEVYGFRVVRGVIWLGYGMNLVMLTSLLVVGSLPGAYFWSPEQQAAYALTLGGLPSIPFLTEGTMGPLPGILLASFTAYLIGDFANSTVLALLKFKMHGRLLFVRTIGSTVVGQGLNSFIFNYMAFGLFGDWPASTLFVAVMVQWVFKILYEALATPLTYLMVNLLKRKERLDVIDPPHALNPLGIFT